MTLSVRAAATTQHRLVSLESPYNRLVDRGGNTLGRVRSKLAWLIALAAVATFVLWLIGIFALNRSAKYGKVGIPGSKVVNLPTGEVDVSFDAQVTSYGGSSNVSLPIPHLGLSVVPVGGGLIPGYQSSVGGTTSVNSDAHRQVAKLDVPASGSYRVTVSGDVGGFIDPTLELGAPGLATKILLGGSAPSFPATAHIHASRRSALAAGS